MGARQGDGNLWPRVKTAEPSSDIRPYLLKHLAFGRRLWVLFHPQYYSATTPDICANISKLPWTVEYWHGYQSGRPLAFWDPVRRHLDQLAKQGAMAYAL